MERYYFSPITNAAPELRWPMPIPKKAKEVFVAGQVVIFNNSRPPFENLVPLWLVYGQEVEVVADDEDNIIGAQVPARELEQAEIDFLGGNQLWLKIRR